MSGSEQVSTKLIVGGASDAMRTVPVKKRPYYRVMPQQEDGHDGKSPFKRNMFPRKSKRKSRRIDPLEKNIKKEKCDSDNTPKLSKNGCKSSMGKTVSTNDEEKTCGETEKYGKVRRVTEEQSEVVQMECEEDSFMCYGCNLMLHGETQFGKHIRQCLAINCQKVVDEGDSQRNDTDIVANRCKMCTNVFHCTDKEFDIHLERCRKLRSFGCVLCGMGFENKVGLIDHRRQNHVKYVEDLSKSGLLEDSLESPSHPERAPLLLVAADSSQGHSPSQSHKPVAMLTRQQEKTPQKTVTGYLVIEKEKHIAKLVLPGAKGKETIQGKRKEISKPSYSPVQMDPQKINGPDKSPKRPLHVTDLRKDSQAVQLGPKSGMSETAFPENAEKREETKYEMKDSDIDDEDEEYDAITDGEPTQGVHGMSDSGDKPSQNEALQAVDFSESKCMLCEALFDDSETLDDHKEKCRIKRPYGCTKCSLGFMNPGDLRLHKSKFHKKQLPKTCDICQLKFRGFSALLAHKESCTGKLDWQAPFACPLCSESFTNTKLLKDHHRLKHGIDIRSKDYKGRKCRYTCSKCAKCFRKKENLAYHMNISHSEQKLYECKQCGKKIKNLALHMEKHNEVKAYVCGVCKKGYSSCASLNRHMNIHFSDEEFFCTICEKRFANKYSLANHINVHLQNRNFKCRICEKLFMSSPNLQRHMTLHTQ